jgi:hypothetical protein
MMRVLPWVLAVALALGCVSTIIYAIRQERAANAQVSRETEAARLREEDLKGVVLVEQKRARDVEDALQKAMARNSELETAVKRARKSSPGAKAVAMVQASTGPLVASSSPELPQQTYDRRPCLVYDGDQLDLRIDEALLKTRAGNQLVVGTASVWRLEPEARIAGGPFEGRVSTASGERDEPVRRAGWGVGPSVWGSSSGLAYGAVLSPPPLDMWRLQMEVAAGLGFGDGGVSGSALVLGRFR